MTESHIRKRIEDWAGAIRAKDIDGVVLFHAPDVISSDIGPPLRYAGKDSKRRAWNDAATTPVR